MYQPDRRGDSWKRTIRDQRQRIATMPKKMPSLRHLLDDPEWNEEVWTDALDMAVLQTELTYRPKVREWSLEQVLAEDYLPS
ncbi:DUF29 family protein [Duganella sp. FT109W]|uniref:DUF29 family protein n=1 Tax=Duganella margarita TaxID=2692170 RepID=A0ABW9WFE0_9BURK|nr:DUF29 family protein [Duganella margarita]MYN39115.1 DUF29 family protein [Duganella margarita]